MSEDPRFGPDGGRRAVDLLVNSAAPIYDLIMDAPDLEVGGGENPPPPSDDGDHRPDPDWRLVGLASFMVSFCTVTALRYGKLLLEIMR